MARTIYPSPICENTQYDSKESGCTYKMMHIKATTHPRLPTLVPNRGPDIVFFIQYDDMQIFPFAYS